MAAARAKQNPIGSAAWIRNEREQTDQMMETEVEEFSFSVRNEMDWLNEHMSAIFSKKHAAFVDAFKTPGKLRGKTPRTARKRDPLAPRQPLTDLFGASNAPLQQFVHKTPFLEKVAQFQVAEDLQNDHNDARPVSRSKSPQRIGKPGNTDSGYHGMMTEDEMEIDVQNKIMTDTSQQSVVQKVPLRDDQPRPQPRRLDTAEPGAASDDSFVSAKEGLSTQSKSEERTDGPREVPVTGEHPDEMVINIEVAKKSSEISQPPSVAEMDAAVPEPDFMDQDVEDETSHSPSETSSPAKPVQRKSSFTFAALPAREPLTMQSRLGSRISQAESRSDAANVTISGKGNGTSIGASDEFTLEVPEASKVYSKNSTQSLHERIKMLGQTKEPRPSKSIPNSNFQSQATQNQSPSHDRATSHNLSAEDSEHDWIVPTKSSRKVSDGVVLARKDEDTEQETISAVQLPPLSRPNTVPDLRPQTAISAHGPNQSHHAYTMQSATPAGSPPSKKHHEGPLSASKNKLYSVLKSAKSIFASSASASAAAKLEAHNNAPSRSPAREGLDELGSATVFNMPGAMYSEKQMTTSPARPLSVYSALSRSPSKKSTRSSTESERKKEKDRKAQEKAAEELEKAREIERQRAAKEQQKRANAQQDEAAKLAPQQQNAKRIEHPPAPSSDTTVGHVPPTVPSKSILSAGKPRAPGRPMRAVREPAQTTKPAPVAVRVGSQFSRFGSSSALNKSQHESAAPPPATKSTLRTASAQGSIRSSTAPSAARVKALDIAARKKEAADRAAAKKAEQKREVERELERKRAAKLEEERRADEERKAAEQQRVQEARVAAQRQAEVRRREQQQRQQEQQRLEQQRQQEQLRLEQQKQQEQQRLEQQKQLEQQRREEENEKAKAAHELAETIKRERAQQAATHPRGDVASTLRHLVKSTVPDAPTSRPPIQMNPAKPPKRPHQGDDEGSSQTYQHPGMQRPGLARGPPSYQQNDAKRRRTNEEEHMEVQEDRPSVMAPPKRFSNMRKESTLNKPHYGHNHASGAPIHNAQSMFRSVVNAQHQLQTATKSNSNTHPSQMVQVVNGRIPFAESANPPPAPTTQYLAPLQHHGVENMHPGQNKYKTPIRPAQVPKSAKSSPLYPNGDSIALPEIQTDSEDEDDEDDDTGFRAPSWVASPALRELLTQQQLVDPETVFGPIGELKMDEVFRNGKNQDRLKRFRDRGSSAAWIESGDAVTSAEKRKDMELRERVMREGGWRYDPSI